MAKRIWALMVSVILLMVFLPSAGSRAGVYEEMGNMEVVNCNEWVSMREEPSTRAKRLVKVSLGAVVSNCRQSEPDWIYGEYDGYSGYILAEYLTPCENETTFSAMLITNCETGAEFYPTLNAFEAVDFIPADTLVRNCHLYSNGRVYVEWGARCGFVDAEFAVPYNALGHYPAKVTLYYNWYNDANTASAPALKAVWKEDFDVPGCELMPYVQEDSEMPCAEFVLCSDSEVTKVHLYCLDMIDMDGDIGLMTFEASLENIQYLINAESAMSVSAVIDGTVPNLAVGYEDPQGVYRFAFVEISGEDGSLLLREF